MKTKISAAILITLMFTGAAFPQVINKPKLDSLFDILARKNKAMGSVAISKNGEILYARAIGYASISGNKKKRATVETRYRIGSTTDVFTATMIFQLIDEGKLTLVTTLDKFFPSVRNAPRITIANLLRHSSGIRDFTNDLTYMIWRIEPRTEDEVVARISGHNPQFEPGDKLAYSNSNYFLLSFIIEKITGESYSENLTERITSKIGLANTYVGEKIDIDKDELFIQISEVLDQVNRKRNEHPRRLEIDCLNCVRFDQIY